MLDRSDLQTVLSRYGDVQLLMSRLSASQDGRVVAFAKSKGYGSTSTLVVLVQSHGNTAIRQIATADSPSVSPSGRFVAYFSSASGSRQIWLMDVKNGQTRMVTALAGGIVDPSPGSEVIDYYELSKIAWNGSSSLIAFASATPRPAATEMRTKAWESASQGDAGIHVVRQGALPYDAAIAAFVDRAGTVIGSTNKGRIVRGGYDEHSSIIVVDLGTGATKEISGRGSFYGPLFAKSGNSLFALERNYAANASTSKVHPVTTAIVSIDLNHGLQRPLSSLLGTNGALSLSPDGDKIAFLQTASTGNMSLERPKIVVHDLADDHEVSIAADFNPVRLLWINPSQLAYRSRLGLSSVVVSIDAKSGRTLSRTQTKRSMLWDVLAMGRSKSLLVAEETPDTPLEIRAGSQILWSEGDPLGSLASDRVYVPLQWHSRSGYVQSAMLILPNRRPGRPRGLIVNSYPGQAGWKFDNRVDGDRILLQLGFAVLHINATTPFTWFEYHTQSKEEPGFGASGISALVDDVDGAIDAAVAAADLEPSRICGFGQSNGGGALALYITRGSRFRCAVIYSPAFVSWRSASFLADPSIVAFYLGGAYPWDNPSLYDELDTPSHSNTVRAATLIAVGRRDLTFPVDAVSLFNGLNSLGKNTTLVVYDDQSHVFEGRAELDSWSRKIAFYNEFMR